MKCIGQGRGWRDRWFGTLGGVHLVVVVVVHRVGVDHVVVVAVVGIGAVGGGDCGIVAMVGNQQSFQNWK